ncbi:hypothetical protein WR25_19277 [Diploscapter pachys]|uniref:ACB domain-containing protein n=1 Tax=Diploscapter pachys TaxID=2018661 RepID=A0A2A2LB73_9BILA|nr:hypothetical protein WR25_19277 [Diploscapter pachys]
MGLEMNGNGVGSEQDNGDPNHVKLTEAQLVRSEFGLPLEDCYKVAVKYYKDHEKSGEITVPYDDRVKLMAYSKQVRNGPYSDGSEGAGWFDFVGNDVIRVWRELGSQSKEDAMAAFVFLVDRVCPPFKNFISDQILPPPNTKENGETSELRNLDGNSASGQVDQQAAASWEIYDAQRQHIQQALNAQTFHQFSAYAQRQFPGQPEQVFFF